jgi:hypothetical protein
MCGRIYIKSTLGELLRNFSCAQRERVEGLANQFPRYNGAPSLYYPIIIRDVVRDPDVFGPTFVSARWGLIPGWIKEQKPDRRLFRVEGHLRDGKEQAALCDRHEVGRAVRARRHLGELAQSGDRRRYLHLLRHHLPAERDDGDDP